MTWSLFDIMKKTERERERNCRFCCCCGAAVVVACIHIIAVCFVQHWTATIKQKALVARKNVMYGRGVRHTLNKMLVQYTKWFVFFTLSLCFGLFVCFISCKFVLFLSSSFLNHCCGDFNEITMHFIGFSNCFSLFWFQFKMYEYYNETAHPLAQFLLSVTLSSLN